MAGNIRFGDYFVLILFVTVSIKSKFCNAIEEFQYIEIDLDGPENNHYAPRLINSSSSMEFINGQWVGKFVCNFESWPLPEISWHNGVGLRIESEFEVTDIVTQTNENVRTSTLTIGAFQESYGSQYTCLAVNSKGFEDGVIWLNSPPVLLVTAQNVVSSGDLITAECRHYPGSNIIWKLPGIKENHEEVTFNSHNNDVNSTSVITFTASETDNNSPYVCCAVLQNPEKAISPACTNFTLRVNSRPSLTFQQNCSFITVHNEHFPKCELACRFTGHPVPQSVIWEYCPRIDQCSELELQPLPLINDIEVTSALQLEDLQQGLYKCKASNGVDAEHIFNVTGSEIAPTLVTHNFSIGITNEDVEVNFTCKLRANPRPAIKWMRKEHLWSNGTETLASDENNFEITEETISEDVYQTTLIIKSYGEKEWSYSYYCKAENENGMIESPPLLAYIIDDNLVLKTSKSDFIFEDGDDVNVSCHSGGYPPPLINIRVVSEYDAKLTFLHNEFVNNVTFTADWRNSYVKAECRSVNPLQPVNSPKASIPIYVQHASEISNVHNCTPTDFEENGTCTLQCTVQHSPLSLTRHYAWQYFTYGVHNDTSSYFLVNGTSLEDTPYKSVYSLELSEYYAAYYQFYIQIFNPPIKNLSNPPDEIEELVHVFKIDAEQTGIGLGDTCSNSSDCLAYNSVCEKSLCQCVQPYDIPMDISSNTSACLTEAEPGMMCYNDMQCARAALNYNCTLSHVCECEGFILHSEVNDTGVKCVDPRRVGQRCSEDIQCYLNDENSECEPNLCQCKPGYKYTTFDFRCESENKEMTPGEIFGIILLGLLLLGLLVYFVKRYRDNKRLKKMLEERKYIWPETEWDASERDYSTFDNSSLQFQESNGHIRMSSVRSGSSSASVYSDVRL